MKRITILVFILLILSGCVQGSKTNKNVTQNTPPNISEAKNTTGTEFGENEETKGEDAVAAIDKEDAETSEIDTYETTMKRDLLCLMMGYPGFVSGVERESNGEVYIVMKSGKKILYDDKRKKTYDEKLANADLQDSMELLYPLSDISELMEGNYDPGRIRCYSLLKEVYGGSMQQIEKGLKGVRTGGQVCSFNSSNGAAQALEKAVDEICALAKGRNNIYSNIFPVNGTYNYRVIAGTNQLSPHAFGIAIDFKSDKRDYWKWASRELGQKRINEYPRDVVRVMEENGFIWGGKWAHFDILHFEYRPELVIKARNDVEDFEMSDNWYYGFQSGDTRVKNYIDIIDKV